MLPKQLDHAVVYCHDCGDNMLGIIVNGAKAKCAKCEGYHTGPVDMRRAWVVIAAREKRARERRAEKK